MINVQVDKQQNESNASLLKRFSRRVQESSIIPRVRGNRYSSRNISEYTKKKQKIKRIKKYEGVKKMIKLGKLPDTRRK